MEKNNNKRHTKGRKNEGRPFSKKKTQNAPKDKKKKYAIPEKKETPPTYDQKKLAALEAKKNPLVKKEDELIRLNRYVANAGVCSRREADKLIAEGFVSVNGEVITEMGYKVKPTDEVRYKKRLLSREKLVYVLLNKPRGFITTTKDPEERKIVMSLVENACEERIYPVGRLDRNTSGLLLFTNDGELAKKLSHPSGMVQKIYHVKIDKPMTKDDFQNIITNGVELEDGPVNIDGLSVLSDDMTTFGIELHSGKNRVVRRIFAHFGYEVVTLDRTVYAGLTKIDLPRSKWRFLKEKEVIQLKYFTGKN